MTKSEFDDIPGKADASERWKPRIVTAAAIVMVLLLIVNWQFLFNKGNYLVVYFGRPSQIVGYIIKEWKYLLVCTKNTTVLSLASLVLSGLLAIFLLYFGLRSERRIRIISKLSVLTQTVPLFASITIILVIERALLREITDRLFPIWLYGIAPVMLGLFFTPLQNGADVYLRIEMEIKALQRSWGVSPRWAVKHIYLPKAIPEVLKGLKISSAWAVVGSLITEGLITAVPGYNRTLGHNLVLAFSSNKPEGQTPAIILLATLVGFLLYSLADWAVRLAQKILWGKAGYEKRNYGR